MTSIDRTFIDSLPKAELHLHIEGTLEPELKLELARRNGVEIGQSTVEQVRATYEFTDLTSFLAIYYPAMEVLVTEQDFHDLAMAYLCRAAADGVVRAEIFFDPQAHTSRGIPFSTVIDGLWSAVQEAPSLGVDAALIMCFLRDHSVESARETLEASLPYRDRIVGVGLDSDERGNPPEKFSEVFAAAKDAGYRLTMHCDIDQEQSISNIATVLHTIGVERIDHGTNILEDPSLVAEAKQQGIGFTCCPVSNSFVTEQMKGAEIVQLLREGLKVSIASDDPAYFGGYVGDNIAALAEAQHLTRDEVVQLARNSLEISWADDARKQDWLRQLEEIAAR
ncbi:adenosine deaminase [Brachybacterium ginsengisoli]|uniref:Adenine deaminase n=1 Tax=Brachybacterium ginsengisoli TaxID=1331682 RepID=A0A291H096_9MICO|nr:adenosine deaminase [Brachybacterium ginsengisoli]ATG55830.1 adenosine deaminase [Brachybacterium ginsengisoli]